MFPFPFSFFGAVAEPPELELIDNNFAMEFNGLDEYISAGNPTELQITGNICISAWVKIEGTGNYALIDKYWDGTNPSRAYRIRINNKRIVAELGTASGGGPTSTTSNTDLTVGAWHHVTMVYNSTDIRLYKDGTLDNTPASKTDAIYNNNEEFKIGDSYDFSLPFLGDIDEVAVWNRALEATDVQTIYNATNNNPGKCANLWSGGLGTGLVYWNRMGD